MTVRIVVALALGLGAFPAAALDLKVTGPTGQSLVLTPAEIAATPHVTLTVQLEGKAVVFSGVSLARLLGRVGAPSGIALRGRSLCDVVLVSAADGYRVALALAETDPLFRKTQILVADAADGAPLGAGIGPYRLVVEGDSRGARFARMVTDISVAPLPSCATPP
jgi:hypothetical protein